MIRYKDFLASLGKNERRYLSRVECALCGIPLNRGHCSSCFIACDDETMIKRAESALTSYRPRVKK